MVEMLAAPCRQLTPDRRADESQSARWRLLTALPADSSRRVESRSEQTEEAGTRDPCPTATVPDSGRSNPEKLQVTNGLRGHRRHLSRDVLCCPRRHCVAVRCRERIGERV